MSEPLTAEELVSLETAGWDSAAVVKVARGEELVHRSAAEIRKLREDARGLRLQLANYSSEHLAVMTDNAKLREWLIRQGRHEYGCAAISADRTPATDCDCGLDAILKPNDS